MVVDADWRAWIEESPWADLWAKVEARVRKDAIQVWVAGSILPSGAGAGSVIIDGDRMTLSCWHVGNRRSSDNVEKKAVMLALGRVQDPSRPIDLFTNCEAVYAILNGQKTPPKNATGLWAIAADLRMLDVRVHLVRSRMGLVLHNLAGSLALQGAWDASHLMFEAWDQPWDQAISIANLPPSVMRDWEEGTDVAYSTRFANARRVQA